MSEASKELLALIIVTEGLLNAKSRQQILGELRLKLNMGVPGAQTYYQKAVKQVTEAGRNV